VGVTIAAMLTFAAVAFARTNSYTVTGSTTPATKGSKKKPVPVGIKFNYSITEQGGKRPIPVQKYSIAFGGLRVNSNAFPGCTAAKINADQTDDNCPKGSLIGTGTISAKAGGENNEDDQSINCTLNLFVYNSKKNKAAIYILGGPAGSVPPGGETDCPTTTNAALDANFVQKNGASALVFNVPLVPFRQQLGSIEVSVVNVQSTIKRLTKKVKGKTVGFYEAFGGCKGGKRAVTVTFTDEENKNTPAQALAKC
jgi:hypothetical protein